MGEGKSEKLKIAVEVQFTISAIGEGRYFLKRLSLDATLGFRPDLNHRKVSDENVR
jgi:hypothetical protein